MSKTSKKNISRKYRLKRKTLKRRYSTKKRYRASSQRGGFFNTVYNAGKEVLTAARDSELGQATLNAAKAGVASAENSLTATANTIEANFTQFNNQIFKSSKDEGGSIADTATYINFDSNARTLVLTTKQGRFIPNETIKIDLCILGITISDETITRTKLTQGAVFDSNTNYHGFSISYLENKRLKLLYLWMKSKTDINKLRILIKNTLIECSKSQQQQQQQQQWQSQQPQQPQQWPQQWPQQPQQQWYQPPLPSGWSILMDTNSNRPYYYNNATRQSSWTPPQQ